MSENYSKYVDYISSIVKEYSVVEDAQNNLYPLFVNLSQSIKSNWVIIEKFENTQKQLTKIISELEIDEEDTAYYSYKFDKLREIDQYLEELRQKSSLLSTDKEITEFVSSTYKNASLYDLDDTKKQVLNKIIATNEVIKLKESKKGSNNGCIIAGVIIILFIFIVSQCLNN